jgi:hypothetical protein
MARLFTKKGGSERLGDRLEGKVAVVTGAGRGIGRGEALALASEGAKLVVNDLGADTDGTGTSHSPADEVVAEIKKMGGEAVANYDSVATPEGGERAIKTAIDTFGKLDILVNNAGILRDQMIYDMSYEDWDMVQKVCLYGHFYTTRNACAFFRKQESGRIINTSSVAGLGLAPGQANYAAAKEGIVGFTRQVARDMGRYGVTCNAIRPGAGTRLARHYIEKTPWEQLDKPAFSERMKRMVPEDIAPLIVWLASDQAANVNGQVFEVHTGLVALYSEPAHEKAICKVGNWTIDDMFNFMPQTLAAGLVNRYS